MNRFRNIVFVADQPDTEYESFRNVLALANANDASLGYSPTGGLADLLNAVGQGLLFTTDGAGRILDSRYYRTAAAVNASLHLRAFDW